MKERMLLISLLIASCYASEALREGYELVDGIPYNRNVKADPVYPFCPKDILNPPCTCEQGYMDYLPSFNCTVITGDVSVLVDFFANTFPTYLVRNITVADSQFKEIPANIFGDKQPQRISLFNNAITKVDPLAFENTAPTLEILEVEYNPLLQEFPFTSLNSFPILKTIDLNNNDLRNLTEIGGMSLPQLSSLDISFNPVAGDLPVLPFLPLLTRFSAQGSGITSIPKDRPFFNLPVLEELILSDNDLTTIETNTFEFNALQLKQIDLSRCNISIMEANAFSGINSETQVLLNDNALTTLASDVFKPVLQILAGGSGVVDVTGNPITCCCEVNWLISNADLQTSLQGGVCAGGAPISGLPLDYLIPLCPPLE